MQNTSVVVVGAGHAGVQVAAGLRQRGWQDQVILVDQEGQAPYERPPLSKDLLKPGAPDEPALLRKEQFYLDKGIERVTGSSVTAIDAAEGVVTLSSGASYQYGRLVLCTGSRARPLSAPGAGLPGVHSLRTRDDALAIKRALVPGARVVIIGAGYIGLEVAAAAAKLGAQATVLEFQNRVMNRVTSEPVSRHFEALHQANGVQFVFGAAVTALEGSGSVERVVTSDGSSYAADLVVVGIGVLPSQDLAEAAGLACNDGILVNQYGQTSDPNIYAAGDVTRFHSPVDNVSMRLECIQNAVAQADAVSDHITGREPRKKDIPWFWTVQHEVRLQTAGVRRQDDEVVIRGDSGDSRFSVLYVRDGHLAAIDTINTLNDFMPGKKLIAAHHRLDPALAADPAVPLAQAVAAAQPAA